jgi:hypothetical protein
MARAWTLSVCLVFWSLVLALDSELTGNLFLFVLKILSLRVRARITQVIPSPPRSRTAMLTPLAKLAVLLSAAISLSSLLPSATAAVALMCHDDAACDLFAYRSGDCHQCNCCPRCWYVAKGREEIDMRDISSLPFFCILGNRQIYLSIPSSVF